MDKPYNHLLVIPTMARKKSIIKRIKTSVRNQAQNKIYKSTVKTLSKQYFIYLTSGTQQQVLNHLSNVYSYIDKSIKKGILHQNNGARKKSRLARAYNQQFPHLS